MAQLLKQIDSSKPVKVEVGSGSFPQPGYLHVDCDPKMPDLAAICKMGEEALPFADGIADEILSNHSLEHVSWLKLQFVVKDWSRILKTGGKVFIRTPDLEFVCKTYMEKKTTRESPKDESNMVGIFGDCGPAEWANIKLYAGQDYAGNFHLMCFDFDMLKRLFLRNGFSSINRETFGPIFSPGEIQAVAVR